MNEDDLDLVRHVATERGVRYFHLPIGSPIGGGGRATTKVSLKAPAYMVNGKGYDEFGVALKAAHSAFDLPTQTAPSGPSENAAAAFRPSKPKFTPRVIPRASGAPSAEDAILSLKPRRATRASGAPSAEDAILTLRSRVNATGPDIADVIARSSNISPEDAAAAKAFWAAHKPSPAEAESLSTDLGLDPRHSSKSIRELRKAIKSRKTTDEERASMKVELAKRVAIAKAANDEIPSFTNRLTKALEDKPEDADLAPVIGETLAAHPALGPLAHIWDRLRVTGYNVRKGLKKGEATDEIPRIIARSLASVLTVGLMLHFGVMIPGLPGG